MEPVRFARAGGSKALGCLVYAVLIPVLGLIVGMLGAALAMWGARSAKVSETWQGVAAGAAGLALFGAVAWFGWRDYHRRAGAEVVLSEDQIEVASGGERVQIRYADVSAVLLRFEGWSPTLEVRTDDGRRRRVPSDIAPFERAEPVLLEVLLPRLLERLERELAAGRAVHVKESGARSVGRIFYGLFLLLIAPLLILTLHHAARGFDALRLGVARIRQGWRGRGGGFTLTSEGVLPPGEEARAIPWRELTAESLDGHGITLVSLEGARVSASRFAENFWPLSRLIAARLK
jgi:hypothetical protein